MKRIILVVMLALLPFSLIAEESGLSQAQLDQMMAPVALYPDALLSQMLIASTYPEQVAEAFEWSKKHPNIDGEEALNAVKDEAWDPSVASLTAFPQVLDMMGQKPEWVKSMGDAFLAESEKVMQTVQHLRLKAKDTGTLKSSQEQIVEVEENDGVQTIVIEPAVAKTVYIPVYNPIVVYGPWWYPAYLPYYYIPHYYHRRAGVFFGFSMGIVVGNALWGSFNWRHHDVRINVHRYNTINRNHKMYGTSRHISWKNDLRHRDVRVLKQAKPSVRDIQRRNAQKAIREKNIIKNERKRFDAIYYDKANRAQKEREYKEVKRRGEGGGRHNR